MTSPPFQSMQYMGLNGKALYKKTTKGVIMDRN